MKDFSYAQKRDNRPWYTVKTKNHGYIYLWGLPLLPIVIIGKAVSEWAEERRVWNDNKAKKALDYILPYRLKWKEKNNAYYYCMDWACYSFSDHVPFYLKKWTDKFKCELHYYIETDYEKNGYIKTIEKDDWGDRWVKFEKRA